LQQNLKHVHATDALARTANAQIVPMAVAAPVAATIAQDVAARSKTTVIISKPFR